MKPFNLEAAMRGEPIVTRDGRNAKFIAYVPEADDGCRLLVFVEGDYSASEYWDSGSWYPNHETEGDLFMVDCAAMVLAGIEFPEPMREPLKNGQGYWLVHVVYGTVVPSIWCGSIGDIKWLKRGLIQSTKEGAEQQLRAMIKSVGGSYD